MGMYDWVKGVPNGYDEQVKCWDCVATSFVVGDAVPSVNGKKSYSIRLNAADGLPPRYLIIKNNVLEEVGAENSVEPIFSKWGGEPNQKNPIENAMDRIFSKMREDALRGFRRWLSGTLGDGGAYWKWSGLTEIERELFGTEEIFNEVVKFTKGEPSILG